MRISLLICFWLAISIHCDAQWVRQRSVYVQAFTAISDNTIGIEADARLKSQAFEGIGLQMRLGFMISPVSVFGDTIGLSLTLAPFVTLGANYTIMPEKNGLEFGLSVGLASLAALSEQEEIYPSSILREGKTVFLAPYFGYRFQPYHYGATIKIGWQPLISRHTRSIGGLSVSFGYMLE